MRKERETNNDQYAAILELKGATELGFSNVNEKLAAHDARFDAMDARFDGMDARFDRLETRVSRIEVRVENLATVTKRLEAGQAQTNATLRDVLGEVSGLESTRERARSEARTLAGDPRR